MKHFKTGILYCAAAVALLLGGVTVYATFTSADLMAGEGVGGAASMYALAGECSGTPNCR